MPKIRDILGHVCVETAKRRRKCHRNKQEHSIHQDERCLVVQTSQPKSNRNYCQRCAKDILDRAGKRLAKMQGDLGLEASDAAVERVSPDDSGGMMATRVAKARSTRGKSSRGDP